MTHSEAEAKIKEYKVGGVRHDPYHDVTTYENVPEELALAVKEAHKWYSVTKMAPDSKLYRVQFSYPIGD